MNAHDTEDLLATIAAAEFYIRTQSALYLGFPSILRVESEALQLTRGLLSAVGVSDQPALRAAAPAPFAPAQASPAAVAPVPAARPAPPAPRPAPPPPAPEPEEDLVELDDDALDFEELEDDTPARPQPLAVAAPVLAPDDEETGDPPTFGDPEETEDLLREEQGRTEAPRAAVQPRTIGDAMAFGTTSRAWPDEPGTDPNAERPTEVEDELDDDEIEIEVEDPGQDALVTIEDTSDPRSDLEGLSRMGDSDLDDDDDSAEDEVIVRKDDGNESFDLMPDLPLSDMMPDEEETFVADLADIERMKAKMDSPPPAAARAPAPPPEDVGDTSSEHDVLISRGTPAPAGARMKPPPTAPRPATPRPVAPRIAAPAAAPAPRVAMGGASASAGTPVGGPARTGVTPGLYGNPAVPTIRDRNEPKPRAAAIQIDAAQEQANKSTASASLLEEEELLELGSSEDYGEEEVTGGSGLSLDVQEYEEELEEVEIEEDDIDLEEVEEDVPLEPVDDGPTPAELDAMLHKAAAAVESGDMEAGIDFYSDVLDSDPDNVDAHVKRGRLYLDYGDYSRAMSDFMVAEELAPQNPEPQIAVGDLYFARKDYNRAIDYFNEALKLAPNHAMAFCRRGISHYYRKNYQQAIEDLNRAEKLDKDIPNIGTYISMAKKKVRK